MADHVVHGHEIGADERAEGGGVQGGDAAAIAHPHVVHQDARDVSVSCGRGEGLVQCVGVGHIGHERGGVYPAGSQCLNGGGEPGGGAPAEQDACAAEAKRLRAGQTNAFAGPGDQRALPGQIPREAGRRIGCRR